MNPITVVKTAIFIRVLLKWMVFTGKATSAEIREPEADGHAAL